MQFIGVALCVFGALVAMCGGLLCAVTSGDDRVFAMYIVGVGVVFVMAGAGCVLISAG
jgi:hypothetical protein